MFTDSIELWGAQVSAISHKIKDGLTTSKLVVTSMLDPDLARKLGCFDVCFLPNEAPRSSFTKMELDNGCAAFRATFEPDPALKHSMEITGDTVDGLTVKSSKDGLRIYLKLCFHSDPHIPIAYVLAVGSAEAFVKIHPLQQELDAAEGSEVSIKVRRPDGTVYEEPVAKETVRQALGAGRRVQ
jgi:hypothetical protein